MGLVPREVDPEMKERAVRLVLEHLDEYSSVT